MKRIWITFLSLVLLYGGVAWAIGACLRDSHHADHPFSEQHSTNLQVLGSRGDAPAPVIHCPPVRQQAGPAARLALTEIHRSTKSVALHANLLPGALPAALENELWLGALFKRYVTFSPPAGFARHLLLSVFRI
jgi:hypothetical protein